MIRLFLIKFCVYNLHSIQIYITDMKSYMGDLWLTLGHGQGQRSPGGNLIVRALKSEIMLRFDFNLAYRCISVGARSSSKWGTEGRF